MEYLKATITNFQAVNLYKLSQTKEFGLISFKQLRHYLAIQKNVKNLKELYESLVELEKKAVEPSPEYIEFDSIRMSSISPYLQKDDKGVVIQDDNGVAKIIEGYEKTVESIFKDLVEKYKLVIEEHNKKLMSWSEFLNSDSDVKISKIPVDDVILPEGFSNSKFDILSLMLDVSEV